MQDNIVSCYIVCLYASCYQVAVWQPAFNETNIYTQDVATVGECDIKTSRPDVRHIPRRLHLQTKPGAYVAQLAPCLDNDAHVPCTYVILLTPVLTWNTSTQIHRTTSKQIANFNHTCATYWPNQGQFHISIPRLWLVLPSGEGSFFFPQSS